MKLYVLTCVNEELKIVDLSVHTSIIESSDRMVYQYNRELESMKENDEDISENDLSRMEAYIVYGDQPYEYKWSINVVEA